MGVMDVVLQLSVSLGVNFRWGCLFWWVLIAGVSLLVFCFRVFRLYTASFVCTSFFSGLCSSCAEIWFIIKFC